MKTSLPVVLLIFTPLAVVHSPFYMVAETGERHTEASVFTQAPVDHKAVYFEKYRTNHPSFDPEMTQLPFSRRLTGWLSNQEVE